MKRMMALLLAAVMVMSLLAGCGGGSSLDEKTTTEADEQTTQGGAEDTQGETESGGEESTEAPKTEITYPLENAGSLTWYVQTGIDVHADYTDVSESPLHNYLKVATGVDIEWMMVPIGADAGANFNLLLESETLPDVITGDKIRYEELFDEGLIYDLTPYLPEYAPDYWAWLNEDEMRMKQVSLISGEIVYFASGTEELNCYSYGPLIRKDWLDECGLDIPYTLDEWETVLIAFRDRYGIAPLSIAKALWFDMFGLASGTGAHGGMTAKFYVDENGKIQCAQLQPEWKELIIEIASWYAQGLIDPDIGTIGKGNVLSKASVGQVGMVVCDEAHSSRIPVETAKNDPDAEWIGIPYPVPEKGDPVVYCRYEGMDTGHATVITTDCTEEKLITALKMLNYGYTEEGMITYNFGEEGVSYYIDDNGEIQLTDLVINDPKGKSNAINRYSPMNDGVAPTVKLNRFAELRYEDVTLDAFEQWSLNSEMLTYKVPALRYTIEEKDRQADLKTTIDTYLKPFASKCVVGDLSLEEQWANHLKNMEDFGIYELLELMQTAYDRMYKE